jgi:hypothetical protein
MVRLPCLLSDKIIAAMTSEAGAPFDPLSLQGHGAFVTLACQFQLRYGLQTQITGLVLNN